MKKTNKKGFTIVELVIVIAVIAILSAVLIPTFGGIIDQANESKAIQEANNAYKNVLIEVLKDGKIDETSAEFGDFTFTFADGKLTDVVLDGSDYDFVVSEDGVISIAD